MVEARSFYTRSTSCLSSPSSPFLIGFTFLQRNSWPSFLLILILPTCSLTYLSCLLQSFVSLNIPLWSHSVSFFLPLLSDYKHSLFSYPKQPITHTKEMTKRKNNKQKPNHHRHHHHKTYFGNVLPSMTTHFFFT